MKARTEVALAIGAGYLLGRTRKMRLALMIAAGGATGGLGKAARVVVDRGTKQLGASPELAKIAETVQGELMQAVKTAAVTAASSRIDSLSSRLTERVPGASKRDEDEDSDRAREKKKRRSAEEEPEDELTDEEPEEELSDEEEEEEPSAEEEPEDELSDEEEEEELSAEEEPEEEEEPVRRAVPRQRSAKPAGAQGRKRESSTRRAPVRRARR
jgi:flagellar biosynthesis GTPase FlhF